jgi:hypothetical protein
MVFSLLLVGGACGDDDSGGVADSGVADAGDDTGGGGDVSADALTDADGGGGEEVGETYQSNVTAADGGVLETGSGTATLDVPAGALDEDTDVTVTVGAATSDTASLVYDYGPDGLTFDPPATLTIEFTGPAPSGYEAVVARLDGSDWVALDGSVVDGATVSAPVDHFTSFAVTFRAIAGIVPSTCDPSDLDDFPCGGDPVGRYIVSALCNPEALTLICPASGAVELTGEGAVSFSSSSALVPNEALIGLVSLHVGGEITLAPDSCGGLSCTQLEAQLSVFGTSCAGTTECVCSLDADLITGPPQQPFVVDYAVSGTNLSFQSGLVQVPFCRTGDELVVELGAALVEQIAPEYGALGDIMADGHAPDLTLVATRAPCPEACPDTCDEMSFCPSGPSAPCRDHLDCFSPDEADPAGCIAAQESLDATNQALFDAWFDCFATEIEAGFPTVGSACERACPAGSDAYCTDGFVPINDLLLCPVCVDKNVICRGTSG